MRVAQPARLASFKAKALVDNEGLGNEATATMAAFVSTQMFLRLRRPMCARSVTSRGNFPLPLGLCPPLRERRA